MCLKGPYAIVGIEYTGQHRIPGRTLLRFYAETPVNADGTAVVVAGNCLGQRRQRWMT